MDSLRNRNHMTELRRILATRFDESELRTLYFDLGISYDALSGEGTAAKSRELVGYCERYGRIPELIAAGRQGRPEIPWDDIMVEARQDESQGPSVLIPRYPRPDPEVIYQTLSEDYGMGYDDIQVVCTIERNGGGRVQRTVSVRAFGEIPELDTFLLTPESASPALHGREFGIVSVQSTTPGREVYLTRPRESPGTLSAVIHIVPALKTDERLIYGLVEQIPEDLYAIDRSEEELAKRATPYDYFGWNINRPTRRLLLKVLFPVGVKPKVFALEVRFAAASPGIPSERRQQDAEKRLTRQKKPSLIQPEPERFGLQLEVKYPIFGLIYVLRWQPLPKTTERDPEQAE